MYEAISYEMILQRMIDRVIVSNPNLDTREGSIIYDALAPAAVELKRMYVDIDVILDETFADTASREMLIKRASERGILPQVATQATLKGKFNMDIPIGSRFSLAKLNYTVIEQISQHTFRLQCETFGVVGNYSFGTLVPIHYIEGLESAELTELLIPGEDDEETEHLRQRYFKSLDSEAFGGNITDYEEKTNALSGVGGVKVTPVWNGGGTVKIVIINSDFQAPSITLVDAVQSEIDPVSNSGQGVGFAPIGHVVTVLGVQEYLINITTNIVFQEGWTWKDVEPYAKTEIDKYFIQLSQDWASSEELIVRVSQIELRLLNVVGVIDISGTAINGIEQNCILSATHIPARGEMIG